MKMRHVLSSRRFAIAARLIAATLLLVAGGVKLSDRFAGRVGFENLAFSFLPPNLRIILEIGAGAWIVVGAWPALTRWASIAIYAVFAAVSLGNVIAREPDCGCFGSLEIPPHVLLPVDLAVLMMLCLARPVSSRLPGRVPWIALAVITWAGVGANILLEAAGPANRPVRLEPKTWIGKRLPILARIDVRDQIEVGRWKVVFHRHDCRACREALPRIEQAARAAASDPAAPRTALVEIPPFNADRPVEAERFPACLVGHMDRQREWRMTTPAVIEIEGGIVVRADRPGLAATFGKRWQVPPGVR